MSFAKLQLREVLGVDEAVYGSVYGFGAGLFFIGYFLFEVPSNLILQRVGARIAGAGPHLLECPLTGGAPGAQARMLVFMVGGEPVVYEWVRPLLAKLGRASFHVGGLGLGNVAKLVNSLIAFQATWGSLEVLAVATKVGIELRTMIDVIRAGGAGNIFTDRMVDGIDQRSGWIRPIANSLNT